jgi:UDP-MurNAc hydroxylase
MTILARYIYSACIATRTPDVTILHDPWFTDGAYDGAWYQWPKVADPLTACGDCDFIYISHIHPDHYDPVFLRNYFHKYGDKQLLIAKRPKNYLASKAKVDGFNVLEVDPKKGFHVNRTSIKIFPHESKGSNNIDSAFAITYNDELNRQHTIINLNDCIYDESFYELISNQVCSQINVLFLTYTGAGPYPQCFYDIDDEELKIHAINKQRLFLERYSNTIKFFKPDYAVPFAGLYLLGGTLASLNPYRGNCDAIETLKYSDRSVILQEGGDNMITTEGHIEGRRSSAHNLSDMVKYANSINSYKPYDSIGVLSERHIKQMIPRLLTKSARNARRSLNIDRDWYYIFTVCEEYSLIIHVKNDICLTIAKKSLPEFRRNHNYIEVLLDHNHLFYLLTGFLHWNNAIVGSWLRYKRKPDIYHQDVQTFLNFLTV